MGVNIKTKKLVSVEVTKEDLIDDKLLNVKTIDMTGDGNYFTSSSCMTIK